MESNTPNPIAGGETRPLVLIVDDDVSVRESLAAVMEAFGFRTRTACNGFEGLEAVESEAPAAIITDLQMPDMDGFELLSALRRSQIEIPVVAMSGGIGYDILGAAKSMGAAATFPKPLAVFELIDIVSALTAHRAA